MNGQVTKKPRGRAPRLAAALLVGLPLAAWCAGNDGRGALAGAPPANIYSCVTADGRRLTSDRPIAECATQEQRLLNRDGSLRTMVPPTLTAEERARQEARDRAENARRMAQQDLARRDRNLLSRYPDEAAHQNAREAALDTVRVAMKASEIRVKSLAAERKPLLDEAEFYKGQPLPAKLRQQMDANDAATDAQRAAIQNQQTELERVQRLYDIELERLKKLWAGAAPGSLGPMNTQPASAAQPEARK